MLWSIFPHNLCELLQVEIVSTRAGNAWTNTPKLRRAINKSSLGLTGFSMGFWADKNGKGCSSLLSLWSDDSFGDFVLCGAISCEINSAALFYDNWLASDFLLLSNMVQSIWYLLMFLKLVELIHLDFFSFLIFPWNTFNIRTVIWVAFDSWSISDCVSHAIFKAFPMSLLNTRTISLLQCVETRSDPAGKIFSCNLKVCT